MTARHMMSTPQNMKKEGDYQKVPLQQEGENGPPSVHTRPLLKYAATSQGRGRLTMIHPLVRVDTRVSDLSTNCKLALSTSRSLQGKDRVLLVQGIGLGSRHVTGIQDRVAEPPFWQQRVPPTPLDTTPRDVLADFLL